MFPSVTRATAAYQGARAVRLLTTSAPHANSPGVVPPTTALGPTTATLVYAPLSEAQKAYLERVVRVDQAGELGANYIYAGQYFVLSKRYPALEPVLRHMWDQEVHHHDTFNALQTARRVRPSFITPLWKLGAFAIGVSTASLSKEAAMACTVAVETVIGNHYNEQLRVLMNRYDISATDSATGTVFLHPPPSPEIALLKETVRQFRDEELEHLDTAIAHDAEKAVPYQALTEVIKATCKVAIWTAERI